METDLTTVRLTDIAKETHTARDIKRSRIQDK